MGHCLGLLVNQFCLPLDFHLGHFPPSGESKLPRFQEKLNATVLNITGLCYAMTIATSQWE